MSQLELIFTLRTEFPFKTQHAELDDALPREEDSRDIVLGIHAKH